MARAGAAKGWATSSVPIVGCVAWWTYNHVSYVQKVNDDGTVLLEEYNYGGKHSYVTRTFPADRKRIDVGDYYADDRRIRAALGWEPRVPLREGLARTLAFYREYLEHYL